MKLIRLKANMPSFHEINFKDGINIIVGKQLEGSFNNEGKTYNGVGKSLILHLIHFCLGSSNSIPEFKEKLTNWIFTLEFKIDDTKYSASRSTNEQSKIIFCGESIKIIEMRKKMLDLCFGITDKTKNLTFTTLFSRFIRRYRECYTHFDKYVIKETDYQSLINNCYLLGIDIEEIINKNNLNEKQKIIANTKKAINQDPDFKKYYFGESNPEIDISDIKDNIEILKEKITNFNVSDNYHELQKEANDTCYKKKQLENKRFLIENNIKNITESLKNKSYIQENEIITLYKNAKIEIPDMVKKRLDEVLSFHHKLLETRTIRLYKELNKKKTQLNEIDTTIKFLGKRMNELIKYLDSHGALDEYNTLTEELRDLENKLEKIQSYQDLKKKYDNTALEIKKEFAEKDESTMFFLETLDGYLSELKSKYRRYVKTFYPEKSSGLVIKNNIGKNGLRYNIEARIEDDASDGVNEVRIFCFDLLILTCMQSNIRFMAHDSRLFANMDHRQRATLFKLMDKITSTNTLQYICSINEDTLASIKSLLNTNEYNNLINKNIILELTDDSPKSKLLGIQVDINLESSSKRK